jgi:hypothetical protein
MWKKQYETCDEERNIVLEQFRQAEAELIVLSLDSAKRSLVLKV